MDWPTLIATLKAIMQRDGISPQDVAEDLKVSSSSVRNYLALRSRAAILTRERIEKYVAEHQEPAKAAKKPARKPRAKKQTEAKQPAKSDKQDQQAEKQAPKSRKRGRQEPAKQAEAEKTAQAGNNKNATKQTEKQAPAKPNAKQQAENAQAKQSKQTAKSAKTEVKGANKQAENRKQTAKKQPAKQPQQQAKTDTPKQNAPQAKQQTVSKAQDNAPKHQDNKQAQNQQQGQRQEDRAAKVEAKKNVEQAAVKAEAKKNVEQAAAKAEANNNAQTAAAPKQAQQQSQPNNTITPSGARTPVKREPNPLRIYVDESFGRMPEKPFTVGMVLASTELGVMPFKEFTETLYPFGWAPGDEVKAAGKDLANVKRILAGSQNDDIRMFTFRTTTVPSMITVTDDDSTTVTIFPYVSALIRAIEMMQRNGLETTQFQIVIDRTNKLPAEAQRVMEKLLGVYFRLSGKKPCSFHITDGDSRAQKGLQLADFVAHYAYVEDADKIGTFAPVAGILDDPLGNARRFAFYSGLRLLRLKDEAQTFTGDFKPASEDSYTEPAAETTTPDKPMSRAFNYTVDLRETIIEAQSMGLGGKQLEAVRSRLKGLSTTVTNWLQDSQSELLDGLANRTISDFRQRAVMITRVDKPFQPDYEIGEQQFRIFESQLDKVKELIQSYQSTAEA
ncbi:hypothetical protein [Lacticaseibacillus sharpeae]|uniref:DUF3800 domain-containing protein n=1 Tax=Lacticaseibacillus sharpeae JCM 1186 = DSM 20505 TaxID=1291052 RepID=A0A0R1ZJI5_9LACO|nr:hypothetical protein [Lacticaseibacillus sharpeae]KRM55144.1 hypothetical protein FC18_GL001593 [Lacticaseibacillus sharpeae JCM 1186 = DSM 20505]